MPNLIIVRLTSSYNILTIHINNECGVTAQKYVVAAQNFVFVLNNFIFFKKIILIF